MKEVKPKASPVQNKVTCARPQRTKIEDTCKISTEPPAQRCQSKTLTSGAHKTSHTAQSTVRSSGSEIDSSLSADDILSKLVKTSPMVKVMFGKTRVNCVVDTGAETSLISASFYDQHLKRSLGDPQTISTYLRVFGANGLEIPVKGYVEIPLDLLGQNLTAYFLVVDNTGAGEALGRGKRAPVLIGCNILHELRDVKIDVTRPDAEVWSTVLKWYQLTKVFPEEHTHKSTEICHATVSSGSKPQVLGPRESRSLKCRIGAPVSKFQGKTVVTDGCKFVPLYNDMESSQTNVPKGCLIYDSVETTDGRTVHVTVANVSAHMVVIPPHTKIATITSAQSLGQVQLEEKENGIQVTLNRVIVTHPLHSEVNPEVDSLEVNTSNAKNTEPYVFNDGSTYQLPTGLCISQCQLTDDEKDKVVKLIQKHDSTFSKDDFDVGLCTKIPHRIQLSDKQPVTLPYRRIPPHQLSEVRDLLQKLADQGVIRQSKSPYASPVVLVKKKDGSLRMCIDYRQLNAKTVKDSFPLPRIEESLEALKGARYFSSLDLAHGYHQVAMDKASIEATAFRLPFGLYEYTRMPFGLVNAPGTFQRVMESCLGDMNLSDLLIYLDDILIYSDSVSEHIARLDKVLERLGEFGLKVKGKKCKLFQTEVVYLGHVVSAEGIKVDDEKVQKVKEWPTPKTAEHLRSFLGLAGYYRRFIKGFAQVAAPLHALLSQSGEQTYSKNRNRTSKPNLKKRCIFSWSDDAQCAFDKLKKLLTEAPVLAYPDFTQPFVLETDASFKGLGACLTQEGSDGKCHPVAYASRGLRGPESRYPDLSAFKLELLALKWAVVDKFKDYLMSVPFVVLTDNNPLANLKTAKLGACEMRWMAQLASFNFSVKYRAGAENKCADALSRCPGVVDVSITEVEAIFQHKTHTTGIPVELEKSMNNCAQNTAVDHISHSVFSQTDASSAVYPSWSSEQLRNFQETDPILGLLWKLWHKNWTPGTSVPLQIDPNTMSDLKPWLKEWSRYVVRQDVLCRKVTDPIDGEFKQFLTPEALKEKILSAAHDEWGHQGIKRTAEIIRKRCFWPQMSRTVTKHINACPSCVLAKAPHSEGKIPMRHLLAFKPLEILAMDFVKVDKGRGGYEDVLVLTDAFTKFAQAIPCKDQQAITVAKVLRDSWFTRFGVPQRLHSDQGRNFESEVIKELCKLYGVKKSHTTPYHPEGNGQAERFNRTLFSLIKSLEEKDRCRWPDLLSHLVFVYNTTPHTVTRVAPFTLLFGREPTLPLDHLISNAKQNWDNDFVEEQATLLQRAGTLVKQRIQNQAEVNEKCSEKTKPFCPFPIGSQVLLRKCAFKGRHKLQNHYEANPYVVVNVNAHQDVYTIRSFKGGPERVVNGKYLRPCPGGQTPVFQLARQLDNDLNNDHVAKESSKTTAHLDPSDDEEELIIRLKPYQGQQIPLQHQENDLSGTTLRRSNRPNLGKHSNPFHLPRSAHL